MTLLLVVLHGGRSSIPCSVTTSRISPQTSVAKITKATLRIGSKRSARLITSEMRLLLHSRISVFIYR
jgi:hypothetical protein